jgi:hypothetical protein
LSIIAEEVTYVDRDHELTVVLADGTRYRIYRCIAAWW